MSTRGCRTVLVCALPALALLYLGWFHDDRHRLAAWLVFALPPLLLWAGLLRRWRQAGFWAAVCALFWFSHGVMSAWAHAGTRLLAASEIVLALLVIGAASLPGLAARRQRRREAATGGKR